MKGYRQGVKVCNQLSCTPLKGTYYQKTIHEGELTVPHVQKTTPRTQNFKGSLFFGQEFVKLELCMFQELCPRYLPLHVSGTLP